MKPLLVIFQFRLIDRFLKSVESLNFDKLWIKFYPQKYAYNIARNWFLKSDYTHFILLPDDLIVTQRNIEDLLESGHDVVSGYCNVNTTDRKDEALVSFSLPPDPPSSGKYEDYNFLKLSELADSDALIEVSYQGTAPSVISRSILEKIPFRDSQGCCIDSCFCLDIAQAGIKQYVDLRVRTEHLKRNDESQMILSYVGKLSPSVSHQ